MAKSDTILGRAQNRKAFTGLTRFSVSVYATKKGRRRYSDPLQRPHAAPRPSVVYRIVIKPKQRVLSWWTSKKPPKMITLVDTVRRG